MRSIELTTRCLEATSDIVGYLNVRYGENSIL